jgi:hypothetical protein
MIHTYIFKCEKGIWFGPLVQGRKTKKMISLRPMSKWKKCPIAYKFGVQIYTLWLFGKSSGQEISIKSTSLVYLPHPNPGPDRSEY